jgi:hypothetical protein
MSFIQLTVSVRIHILLVQARIGVFLFHIEGAVGLLLRRFTGNLALGEIGRAQMFQLGLTTLRLDRLLKLGISHLGLTLRRDPGEFDVSLQFRLAVRELGVGLGLLCFALGLEDGGLGVDLGNLLLRAALFLGLADLAAHSSFGDIDLGLVESAFVGFATEKSKVLASRSILEFFDVGVIAFTELV